MTETQPSTSDNGYVRPMRTGDPSIPTYLKYRTGTYNPMNDRMILQDAVARQIYLAKSVGLDRVQLAAKVGINASVKSGSRKISEPIQALTRGLPGEVGTFQKLNGRFRLHGFYHKSFRPGTFQGLFKEISDLIGFQCPFKVGQVIEFPEHKLTRMRVTDFAMKRIIKILRCIEAEPVNLLRAVHKKIIDDEAAEGSAFEMDKKSFLKLVYALEREKILRIYTIKVVESELDSECELKVITRPDVKNPEDPRVGHAILTAQREYHSQGRLFPSGQTKKRDHTKASQSKIKPDPGSVQLEPFDCQEESTVFHPDNKSLSAVSDLFQKKMIRLHVFHEFVYRFVFHPMLGQPGVPTYDERFAATVDNDDGFPVDEMYVYDDTPNSLFRFVPPLPVVSDAPRGWFRLRQAIRAMPLSVYVLVFDTPLDRELRDYLDDPIRRHTMLNDLPLRLRRQCIHRKTVSVADIDCVRLCGMALMLVAPESKTSAGPLTRYYICREGVLYDTSIAEKGYAIITQPPETFQRYVHKFETSDDVHKYWYHLRAISHSTALNMRTYRKAESEQYPETLSLHKKFARECFTKDNFAAPSLTAIDWRPADLPGQGAALIDAGMFSHLKRHWDFGNGNQAYVDWFITRYLENGNAVRAYVENNVVNLNKFWLSIVQTMMANTFELFKKRDTAMSAKKNVRFDENDFEEEDDEEPPTKRKKLVTFKVGTGKRVPDQEDIESASRAQHLRYRFTQRERDLMVLVKAVCQFLNPTGKMWVDPTVMRRIMKAYLEESNNKTINCLMAACVRETGHPKRLIDIWHLVHGLGSFTQMRDIRNQLASILRSDFESKAEYFCLAFDIAYRLVTRDIPRLPSALLSDEKFDAILDRNNLTIGVTDPPTNNKAMLLLSTVPSSETDLHERLLYAWIINMLLFEDHSVSSDLPTAIVRQRGAEAFYSAINRMHDDGVLVQTRPELNVNIRGVKNQVIPSVAFCTYFNHSYRFDVMESIEMLPNNFIYDIVAYSENVGVFLRLAYMMTDPMASICATISKETFPQLVGKSEADIRRQMRETETSAIKLSKITIEASSDLAEKPTVSVPLSSFVRGSTVLDANAIPDYAEEKNWHESMDKLNGTGCDAAEAVLSSLKEIGYQGLTFDEICAICFTHDLTESNVHEMVTFLEDSHHIFACGIDTRRFVHMKHALEWALVVNEKAYYVKPWSNPDGSINWGIFRWMAEMVFVSVHESPNTTIEKLRSYFCNVLHGAIVDELLHVLVRAELIEIFTETVEEPCSVTPFKVVTKFVEQRVVRATYNSIELFTVMFEGIAVPEYLRVFKEKFRDS